MIKSFSVLTAGLVGLGSFLSCASGHCESKINCETQVVLKIEGETEGQYIVEKRLTRDRLAIDTLNLDDSGELKFGLEVDKIEIFSIRNITKQSEIIFVANKGDKINIAADSKDIGASFTLNGTAENESLTSFIQHERSFQSFADSLNKIYLNLKKNNMHYAVEKEFTSLYKAKSIAHEGYVKSFIDENPERFINLLAVRSLDVKKYPEYYAKVKEGLEYKFPTSEHVVVFAKDVGRLVAREVGGMAPAFTLPSLTSGDVKLSDFKGKYVLLDFWATWCRPCIKEIPNLKAVREQFSKEDFEIVSICVDKVDFKPNWKRIIAKYEANWPQLFDASGTAATDYAIEYFPTIILLNKKGEIIARNLRGHDISQKLQEVFEND
ncbi:MAG: peroxiredoxin [Glaciecola sp.]|jgi:peroxiredoxin